jgi:hypothetical protein
VTDFIPAFTATVGTDLVDWADTLDGLLASLEGVFEPGLHADVAVWRGNRLIALWLHDGRRIDLGPPSGRPAAVAVTPGAGKRHPDRHQNHSPARSSRAMTRPLAIPPSTGGALRSRLRAAGFRPGTPPGLPAEALAIDLDCYSRMRCPLCGGRLAVEPWTDGASYRLLSFCKCLFAVEA